MQMFDMHIHTDGVDFDTARFVKALEDADFYGGCVFSPPPTELCDGSGMDFEERLDKILSIVNGYEGRLFPVLWMHPFEENAEEKVKIAVKRGIAAFKFILYDCYAGDERCISLFRVIASLGKPIFFHSGILWGRRLDEIAKYNRPINWEAMLKVPNLRFSLGHCSWPWVDECIALYGRLNDAKRRFKDGDACEMFFDLTPGTPDNYREELLTKLCEVDMDNAENIMFGTDQWAERYNSERLTHIFEMDRKILDKLGVSLEARKRMYRDNLMRFLGIEEKKSPERLYFTNENAETVIKKWYERLSFPMEYDGDFSELLKDYRISDAITVDKYDYSERDGRRNLLSLLFMCEETERRYRDLGIEEKILIDTLSDIRLWTDAWTQVRGELCLFELPWLQNHMKCKLFRIGSLEFKAARSEIDCHALGLSKGDDIVEIHIPKGADLSEKAVKASIDEARDFYAKHFPSYAFTHFTFHSWIMDEGLKGLLRSDSNIVKFQNMLERADESQKEDYAALRYVFRWNTTRMTLRHEYPSSSLAEKMKAHVLSGGRLFVAGGAMKR